MSAQKTTDGVSAEMTRGGRVEDHRRRERGEGHGLEGEAIRKTGPRRREDS